MATMIGRNVAGLQPSTVLQVQIGRGVAARSISIPAPDDLQITWTVPGGDDTCSFTLPWPGATSARPDALTPGMPVRVVDCRSGEIQWQGRVVDPGTHQSGGERTFHVEAVGSRHDAERIATLKNYIDRDPANWRPLYDWKQGPMTVGDGEAFTASGTDALAIDPSWDLTFPLPQNSTTTTGAKAGASYLVGYGAALGLPNEAPRLFAVAWDILASVAASTSAEVNLGTLGAGTINLYLLAAWPTVQTGSLARQGFGVWTSTDGIYWTVRWVRTGGSVTNAADQWLSWANLITVGRRVDRYGVVSNRTTSGIAETTLYCSDVVEDLLGTMLDGVFVAGTVTQDPSILIDQACWYKGITATGVLEHVAGYDADSYWAVWAPATSSGLPRLDWRKWGTTARYVLDGSTDYELAGGADLLANSALIAWERGNGIPQTTRATVTNPAVSRMFPGATRDIVLDLSDRGPMDGPQARTLGYEALTELAADRSSGSATVRGTIMDDAAGRLVQPWEIRPGSPVRLGGPPQQYTGGVPLRYDGETTFKLTQVTYSAGSNAAVLSLDGGSRTAAKEVPKSNRRHALAAAHAAHTAHTAHLAAAARAHAAAVAHRAHVAHRLHLLR